MTSMFMRVKSNCAHHLRRPLRPMERCSPGPRRDLSRIRCADWMRRPQEGMDQRDILASAHRGVTHVRGKDCVHPDIGLVIVRMISFPARESGQRARMAVR